MFVNEDFLNEDLVVSVICLINVILSEVIKEIVFDIYIEIYEKIMSICFCIDGVLWIIL